MAKVWFVTGAARGLGKAIARAALAAGHKVVATGRDTNAVRVALGESSEVLAVPLDVTRPGDAARAVRAAVERFGRIDVLVNNAGYGLVGALEEVTDEEFAAQFATNVGGVVAVTRAVLPQLRAQRAGHIVNISSAAGIAGFAGASAYSGTKFAVEGISEALAQEVAPLGIKVTIVEPGYFRTEFLTSGSVVFAKEIIDDYAATVGAARRGARDMNGKQGGDPDKLAHALLTLVEAKHPPLRFSAGEDAVGLLEHTLAAKAAELAAWNTLSLSLGHAH